jgi:tRNA/rRNA methyltransferase
MKHEALDRIDIILVGTLNSGNIGSVARAMKNTGLSCLKLVNPQCEIDDQTYCMATTGEDIIKDVKMFSGIREAIHGSSYVYGTTSRDRRWRNLLYPEEMAKKALSLSQRNSISILFGPEDKGLSNDELELCSEVVTIPTSKGASSLNISHAVMVICYEFFRAAEEKKFPPADNLLAPTEKVERMYDHMKEALLEIGFLDPNNPEHALGNFRRILTRAELAPDDVQLIRGVFRQLLWYIKKSKKGK